MRSVNAHFIKIEGDLKILIERHSEQLTHEQKAAISEVIQVGEYGIAVEWLVHSLKQNQSKVDSQTIESIQELVRLMRIEDEELNEAISMIAQ